jgi:TetR/AcrR family transcriptional regulator, transcriptional repressor for nem operon
MARRSVTPATRLSRADAMQKTREALIQAGMELFARHGLDAPSLDAICERAGKTRGAFYVHFQDRDDLLVAVMDRVGAAYLDAVLPAALAGGSAPVSFEEIVQRFVASVQSGVYPLLGKPGGVRPHQLVDACVRNPVIRARYVGLVATSIERLAAAVEDAQFGQRVRQDVDAERIAGLLLALIIGGQTMLARPCSSWACRSTSSTPRAT